MNTVHNYYCTVFNRKLKELSMIFSVVCDNFDKHFIKSQAPSVFILNSQLVWQ